MVASLDGLIAKRDNSISWFEAASNYEKGVAAPDSAEFLKGIDCYVMGARTFEHARELSISYGWPYGDKPTFVLSHKKLSADRPSIEIYTGDAESLLNEKLKPQFTNAWVVGGSATAKTFLRLKLADEIRISILPILLGDGIPYFDTIGVEQPLRLKDLTAYKNGMVELVYEIAKA
jgi:dihydrofolate reductase